MDNTKVTVKILKQALKSNGLTYADVARHLELSEASIKKMFSTCHFTLERVDRICEMLGMDFIDLLRLFDTQRHYISHLTLEQEQELVKDKRLLLVAVCARHRYSFNDILKYFQFTKGELYHYLSRLEALNLLELHPNDRIRILVAEDFRWLPHGPIEGHFEKNILNDFTTSDFYQEQGMRLYMNGPLTVGAREVLAQRLNMLAYEFTELLQASASYPISEKSHTALLFATSQWEPSFMVKQRKNPIEASKP